MEARIFSRGRGDKHLRDIRGMLLVSERSIDRTMLGRACTELGLTELWQRAQAT